MPGEEHGFPTLCRVLDIKPEDRTELDQVQRFITFCNEARRAPCVYPGLGRPYDEMAKPLAKAKWEEEPPPPAKEKGLPLVIAHLSPRQENGKTSTPESESDSFLFISTQ